MPDIPWTMIDNRIVDIVENPCQADWWTIVTLAFPAAHDSLEMLIVPQPEEILEQTVEAKFARKRGRFRGRDRDTKERDWRKKGGGRRRRGVPQIEPLFLEGISGLARASAKHVGPASYLFHGLFNAVERAAWWWLVYDAVDNFFYRWASGIIYSEFCQANAFASYSAALTFTANGETDPPGNPDWETTGLTGPIQLGPNSAGLAFVKRGFAVYTATVRSLAGKDLAVVMRLTVRRFGETVFSKSTTVEIKNGEPEEISLTIDSNFCTQIEFDMESVTDFEAENGYVAAVFL